MELTFVHQYGETAPRRRRLAKACESCRARKKRCTHFAGAQSTAEVPESETDIEDTPANDSVLEHTSPSTANAKRFVSDLNPTATFLQRSTPPLGRKTRQSKDCGIWVDKREWDELVRQKASSSGNAVVEPSASDPRQRPHPAVLVPLIDIYFFKVNPILPLLNEFDFRRDYAAALIPDALTNALCVVAAKDADAGPHLRLSDNESPVGPREFCSRLYASITAALRVPHRFEKITLIRILALVSLHSEGQDGSEEASMALTQAMHYTQTLGWHLGQQSNVATGEDLTIKRLFWCLWSLDRVNSVINCRPIMMSDVDIAIEPFETGESRYPAFEVWLRICGILNKVISFYRPGIPPTVTGWEDEYSSFEEAVDAGHAWNEPASVLATLHLFYLLVTVLSHRSRGVKYMPRALPSYVRQSLCTVEIIRLMNSHTFSSLHPLPILPYAVSLALSVSYQHLRQSQVQHQQEDARDDFTSCCQVLQKLRRTWSSADAIATIARKVLAELAKATDLASFRVSRSAEGRDSPCPASLNKPHTLIHDTSNDGLADGAPVNHDMASDDVIHHDAFAVQDGLFEGMDDIFGTYLDPNYPLNLDDMTLVDDMNAIDWSAIPTGI